MSEKKHFDIDTLSKNTVNAEVRQAQALEYIAHYLELIEGHLARSAAHSDNIGMHLSRLAGDKNSRS